jgi:hypothetical protein
VAGRLHAHRGSGLAGEAHSLCDVDLRCDSDHDVRIVADRGIEAGDLRREALVASDVDGAGDGVAQARDNVRVEFDSHGGNVGEATDMREPHLRDGPVSGA